MDSQLIAGFYDLQHRLNDSFRVLHSLLEHRYDYDNNHIVGNTETTARLAVLAAAYTRARPVERTLHQRRGSVGTRER